MKEGNRMNLEFKTVEKFRQNFRENDYRFLIARIAIFHLKHHVKNKTELYVKVNDVLLSQQLKPVSFGFIKTNV
jgi:hypothetical protein